MPRKIRSVKLPELENEIFLPEQLRQLVGTAQTPRFHRYMHRNGAHVGLVIAAAIQVAYDTGLRHADLFKLQKRFLQGDQIVILVSKSQRRHAVWVRPDTVKACLAAAVPTDDRLLPWGLSRTRWFCWWRILCDTAGLPNFRTGLQQIRRTSANYVKQAGGNMAEHLGHGPNSPGVAERYYENKAMSETGRTRPPPLT
jgi:integrase